MISGGLTGTQNSLPLGVAALVGIRHVGRFSGGAGAEERTQDGDWGCFEQSASGYGRWFGVVVVVVVVESEWKCGRAGD